MIICNFYYKLSLPRAETQTWSGCKQLRDVKKSKQAACKCLQAACFIDEVFENQLIKILRYRFPIGWRRGSGGLKRCVG